MKKYKVLKKIPYTEIGNVFSGNSDWLRDWIPILLEGNYIEEIEENKSLTQKFREASSFKDLRITQNMENLNYVAKQHYLQLFDESSLEYFQSINKQSLSFRAFIRQRLSDG